MVGVEVENEHINKDEETNKQAVITTNKIISTTRTHNFSSRLNDSNKINSPLRLITITNKEASGTTKEEVDGPSTHPTPIRLKGSTIGITAIPMDTTCSITTTAATVAIQDSTTFGLQPARIPATAQTKTHIECAFR